MNDDNSRRKELESRLEVLTIEFDQLMRARGFEPAQAENVALPTALARLYSELQTIRGQLDEIQKGES